MSSILKVDTIQNTGGTTGLTIDSSGVVATPARPAFSAYHQHASTSVGLNNTIVFNNTRSNVGSHYSTTTGKFTAPIAGLYQFNFVGFGCGDTSGNVVPVNRSVYATLYNETTSTNLARSYVVTTSSTSYPNMSLSSLVPLAANDVIRIDGGGAYIYSDSSGLYATFSGFLVG